MKRSDADFNACHVVIHMVKLYLLGGENTIKQSAKEINQAAFIDAGGSPSVLVFPWARASFDNIYARRRRLCRYFKSLGAKSVHFADYSEPLEEIADRMSQSDLVYLTGGQLTILFSRLIAKGVDDLLRKYDGVIIGRSAGALVLAQQGVVTNRYTKATKFAPGLGIADLCLKTHYESSKDSTLRKLSKTQSIYAVPINSAILYDNGDISFVGEVFLFEDGDKKKAESNTSRNFPNSRVEKLDYGK
jgi:peptidase E